jgi:hypothetical protein
MKAVADRASIMPPPISAHTLPGITFIAPSTISIASNTKPIIEIVPIVPSSYGFDLLLAQAHPVIEIPNTPATAVVTFRTVG